MVADHVVKTVEAFRPDVVQTKSKLTRVYDDVG